MASEKLKPCEHATYVHYLVGGPNDGLRHSRGHCCDWCELDGHRYYRKGDAERMEKGPPGLEVLNCTDDYMEPVFYRVTMEYAGSVDTREPSK